MTLHLHGRRAETRSDPIPGRRPPRQRRSIARLLSIARLRRRLWARLRRHLWARTCDTPRPTELDNLPPFKFDDSPDVKAADSPPPEPRLEQQVTPPPVLPKVIVFEVYDVLVSTAPLKDLFTQLYDSESSRFTLWPPDGQLPPMSAELLRRDWCSAWQEYTCQLAAMDCHRDFREKCVRAALRNVTHKFYFYNIEDVNTELVSDEEDRFMRAFDTLQMYPHVAQMIDLIQRFNIKAYIFSNASKQQLDKLFNNSPDLASYKDSFERIISAEEVEAFKPSQRTYDHILDVVNREAEDVWFVSANPTDLVGAKAAGMQTAWINPRRFTWEDHLGDIWWDLPPDLDLDCVFEAVAEILSRDDTVPYGYRGRRHRNCPEPQVEESDADVEDEEEESVSDNDMTEPEAGADILHPIVIDDDETESEADADDIMSTIESDDETEVEADADDIMSTMELDDETEVEADADEIMSTIESDDETEVDSGPEKDSEMK